jgi:hypothetical protein
LLLKDALREVFWQEIPLVGVKAVFYQKGIILVDQRLGAFVLPYSELTHLVFHTSDDLWLEIGIQKEGRGHLMPANMVAEPHIFLKITQQVLTDKFKLFNTLKEQDIIPATCVVDRSFEPFTAF